MEERSENMDEQNNQPNQPPAVNQPINNGPVAPQPQNVAQQAAQSSVLPSVPAAQTPQAIIGKILVVEDEPFIGDLYKHALTKAGYETEVVMDGQIGLDKAKTGVYDIILLDIVIPQILGLNVLSELKSIPGFKSKIIITTNLEQDDESRAKVESLADAYLIKAEITPTELANFLKDL